ncbi:MAG TPA: ClcB-like voltage-gated chloride channel protein [Casimicrobiaceae bacterium]
MLTRIQRLRIKLFEAFRLSDPQAMLVWAALAGFVGALATVAFRESIRGLQWLVTGHSGSLVGMAKSLPWYFRMVLPALGGLLAGVFLELARHGAGGRANSDYMEAISIGDGRIPVRQSVARSISSLFSVASGGSIGREGSMVQLSATCASIIGRIAKFRTSRLRLLVACGSAAGITSAYNAPIAGTLFVAEIVLGTIAMESFGPMLVASVIANITMREMAGYQPVYEMPPFPAVAGPEFLLFVGLGLFAGILAPQFLRALAFGKNAFSRVRLPLPARLCVGGLIVGALSVQVPEVWGNGYSVVNSLLHTQWPWTLLLLTLAFKIVATASTAGSGAVGGIFTPTLFVGAVIGNLFGIAVHALWPAATSAPFAYAIVGMGAFLAAASQAPLMAILMIFEMTLSYQVVLPLMLAVVCAHVVARSHDQPSMYTVTRHNNAAEKMWTRWHGLRIRDLVKEATPILPMSASVDDVGKAFVDHPVRFVYVVDADNLFRGAISLQRFKPYLLHEGAIGQPTMDDLLQQDFPRLTPNMPLGEALQHFLTHPGERLPVVESVATPRLLGVVSKSDLLLRIQEIAY